MKRVNLEEGGNIITQSCRISVNYASYRAVERSLQLSLHRLLRKVGHGQNANFLCHHISHTLLYLVSKLLF